MPKTQLLDMKTTSYDRMASLLVSLLLLLGSMVAILFGLWFSMKILAPPRAVPVQLVPLGDGAGFEDYDEYNPEVVQPGLEFEEETPSFLEELDTVVDVIAENDAIFSDASPMDESRLLPGGKIGDGRTRGEGTGLAGRKRRWEFQFGRNTTAEQYAAMLDFFGIELGVLEPGGRVRYASRLSSAKPTVREGNSADEQRYYMTWIKGDTESADRELLDKAGIANHGRLVIKFIPPELEAELENREQQEAGARFPGLKSSFFRVLPDGNGYRFELYHQLF